MKGAQSNRSGYNLNQGNESLSAGASAMSDDQNQPNTGLTVQYFQSQLLLDCLLRIQFNSADHEELIAMCLEQLKDNPEELSVLNEFENSYSSNRALRWYLRDCFLDNILNYTLESQDIGNLFLSRGILHDIEQQIEQHKCKSPLHVYRSQLMRTELLDTWMNSIGQCIPIKSFLSATTSYEVAATFLNSNEKPKDNCKRVLLEIDADPRVPGAKPFVQMGSLNYASDKEEVLFMFGSVFLINNISCGEHGLYTVEMTLYSDNDHELKPIFDDMKKKYGDGEISLLTFGQVLYDLNRFDEVEEYTNRYLGSLPPDHEDSARCYDLLGSAALAKGDYNTSLTWYKQSLEFAIRTLPNGDPRIAERHDSIGDVYRKKGSYNRALTHYKSALEIKSACLPSQHPSIATTIENMGLIYEYTNDLPQALSCFQRAAAMYRRAPETHDKLAQIEEHIRRVSRNYK